MVRHFVKSLTLTLTPTLTLSFHIVAFFGLTQLLLLKNGAKTTPPWTGKHQRRTIKTVKSKVFNLTQLQKADEGLATQSTKKTVKTGTVKLRKILDCS